MKRVLALAAVLLVTAACGSDDGGADGTGGAESSLESAADIQAAAADTDLECPMDPVPFDETQADPTQTVFPVETLSCSIAGVEALFSVYASTGDADAAVAESFTFWCENVSDEPPGYIDGGTWVALTDPSTEDGGESLEALGEALGLSVTMSGCDDF